MKIYRHTSLAEEPLHFIIGIYQTTEAFPMFFVDNILNKRGELMTGERGFDHEEKVLGERTR